ncbi:hypothetical protein MMC15_006375 [Xylographa vitiligo]|nr:hypothetical protein [Xylographa vitiligo]
MKQLSAQALTTGWSFKQTDIQDAGAWMPVAKVPTMVHLDLMANNKIPDPFVGMNELAVEWVGEKSWTYRKTLPKVDVSDEASLVLAFDGLDTLAHVKLNGETILKSDNMFVPQRVDISKSYKTSEDNILEIDFDSALLRAREIEKQHPDHRWLGSNGEMARLGVRKAQFHWGWDWGPVLMTCGPWREVRLETYNGRVADLWLDYEISKDFNSATGTAFASVEGGAGQTVAFNLRLGSDVVLQESAKVGDDGLAKVEFRVHKPALWYPHGYGEQSLYEVTASLLHGETILDTKSKKTGLRKVELVQHKDKHGKSFYFSINGVDVFCGGSDWIPADHFTPRISNDRYRKWLQLMVDGNQVMTRIWGGGIWEEDVFYDTCDELGIMIWHDYMFACGNYPAFPTFLESVKEEATVQLRRLRHHPSITIYAGNNEDYQIQERYDLEYDYKDTDPQHWLKTDFPARYIYEKLLPDVTMAESPNVPYWPGSPWSEGGRKISVYDQTVGDLHQWNVWHGTQEKYQVYDQIGGRFNSEFGLEAFPHIETIEHFVTDSKELYPQSHTIDFHNKAKGHERRNALYIIENFRLETGLKGYIHLTQLAQAEAMMYAYRGWRRQWGDRICGGALLWQLPDSWPCTSWAIVDYFLRKKPAYYSVARVLAPLAIGVQREHQDWSVTHARPSKTTKYQLWVSSSLQKKVKATIELRFISISSGAEVKSTILKQDVEIATNGATDIMSGVINNVEEEPHVLAARLFVDGKIVARDMDWPQPYKYLPFENQDLHVAFHGHQMHISSKKPVKGLVFEEREGVLVSDSSLDVAPGDEQIVTISGLLASDKPLSWTYLGHGEGHEGKH